MRALAKPPPLGFPCAHKAQRDVHATILHATSTLGSLSVRKQQDIFMRQTAAFSRCEHTWISLRALTCDNTAAFARQENTWISLRAQTEMIRQNDCCILHSHAAITLGSLSVHKQQETCSCNRLLRSHAASTLGSPSVRKQTSSCDRLLRSHATSTLGSLSVRKLTCSGETTAAFCIRTPRVHFGLSPCAKQHVPAKRLLRSYAASRLGSRSVRKALTILVHAKQLLHSHAVSTLGSLSVRKATCSGKTTAAFLRREHTWISLRAQRDIFHRKDCCDLALPPR